jgi:BirA family transcriptional regulator, biotin operon repressor / biotin---[acetyl-CoA-carboxylase] ligase
LNVDLLRERLKGLRIGSSLHYFETVDSTNAVGIRLAQEEAAEGTLILADSQTAGRGRFQRVWQSPSGSNLYFSVVLRPDIAPAEATSLTFLGGVAVFEALSSYCPRGMEIKWPNDILINNRKVCGILTEMKTDGKRVEAVMGVGINVNIKKGDFTPEHREAATSLAEETGRELSREDVLFAFCTQFQHWYETFLKDGFEPIRKAWLSGTTMVGRQVRVKFRDEIKEGIVSGIDNDGALLLVDSEKVVQRITAGDATIVKS